MDKWPREFIDDAAEILHEWQNGGFTQLQALDRLWELAVRDGPPQGCHVGNCHAEAIYCLNHSLE